MVGGNAVRTWSGLAGIVGLALALSGCGTSSNLFGTSALDLFSTSSKATTANAAGGGEVDAADITCPDVKVRTGAATLIIASRPGATEPTALDVRYQGSITRTARECHASAGVMTMKVGIEGRVITGPAGGPGNVDVPLRIAVVQEGVNPKTIVSKFVRIPVTVASAVDRVNFTHIDPEISFPLPQPLGLIDAYVVYVGFDPVGAPPEKKSRRPSVSRGPRPSRSRAERPSCPGAQRERSERCAADVSEANGALQTRTHNLVRKLGPGSVAHHAALRRAAPRPGHEAATIRAGRRSCS